MLEPLFEGLAIYTLIDDVLLGNEVLRNCELLVNGLSMLVDLFSTRVTDIGCNFRILCFYGLP